VRPANLADKQRIHADPSPPPPPPLLPLLPLLLLLRCRLVVMIVIVKQPQSRSDTAAKRTNVDVDCGFVCRRNMKRRSALFFRPSLRSTQFVGRRHSLCQHTWLG